MQTCVMFLYFIVYSMIGWCCEVAFCLFLTSRFINRGFLRGPYCPVYGLGALLVVYILRPGAHNIFFTFIFGMLITSVLEYATGFLLEALFHTKWWDYSDHKFHIKGRVCLENSLMFGFLCIFVIYGIHPPIERAVAQIAPSILPPLGLVLFLLMALDAIKTIQSILGLNKTIEQLMDLSAEVQEHIGDAQQTFGATLTRAHERWEGAQAEFEEKLSAFKTKLSQSTVIRWSRKQLEYFDRISEPKRQSYRRLFNAFPNMRPSLFEKQLRELRHMLRDRRQK